MKYIIYKTTNKINQKIYYGFHLVTRENDGYLGSGVLIKRAIAKYGKENFVRETIAEFDNKEDAEQLEKEIVNAEFVLRVDNYNISIGGNVAILFGESNGFYGKTHSKETVARIKAKTKETAENRGYYRITAYSGEIDGTRVWNFQDVMKVTGTKTLRITLRTFVGMGGKFDDPRVNEVARKAVIRDEIRRIQLSNAAKLRFTGVPKTEDHRHKIAQAHIGTTKDWVAEKVNRNPEKIRKTAEKHRGMKRSEETCKKISDAAIGRESKSVGRKCFYDPATLDVGYFYGEPPDGWLAGNPKTKSRMFINIETHEKKMLRKARDGWIEYTPDILQ